MSFNAAEIFYDDIATTWTVASSVTYAAMPGSTAFTGQTNNGRAFQTQKANSSSCRIIIGEEGRGLVRAEWSASFTGAAGNTVYHIALFRNGTKLPMTSIERKLGTAGDIGAAHAGGFFVAETNDIIDMRAFAGGTTGVQVTFNHCQIGLYLLSTSTVIGTE